MKAIAIAAIACAAAIASAAAGELDSLAAPPTQEELAECPLDALPPGELPKGGLRNWGKPQNLSLEGAYVSVVFGPDLKPPQVELWRNTWRGDACETHEAVFRKGPSIESLGEKEAVAFDSSLIDDVFDHADSSKLAPNRGATRLFAMRDAQEGYVILCCVCSDYLPGKVELLPALFISKSGEPGSFKYLGKLKGDCAAIASQRMVWSDGGSILRLDDGRWRIYLNGFGPKLAALEAGRLDGEWKFLRDEAGNVRELLPPLPKGVGCVFPNVVRDAQGKWHLWLTDKWPPQSIWHLASQDGLAWSLAGAQPEITREFFNGHAIKCLRAACDPSSGELFGLLSVYPFWTLHKLSYKGFER